MIPLADHKRFGRSINNLFQSDFAVSEKDARIRTAFFVGRGRKVACRVDHSLDARVVRCGWLEAFCPTVIVVVKVALPTARIVWHARSAWQLGVSEGGKGRMNRRRRIRGATKYCNCGLQRGELFVH